MRDILMFEANYLKNELVKHMTDEQRCVFNINEETDKIRRTIAQTETNKRVIDLIRVNSI